MRTICNIKQQELINLHYASPILAYNIHRGPLKKVPLLFLG